MPNKVKKHLKKSESHQTSPTLGRRMDALGNMIIVLHREMSAVLGKQQLKLQKDQHRGLSSDRGSSVISSDNDRMMNTSSWDRHLSVCR